MPFWLRKAFRRPLWGALSVTITVTVSSGICLSLFRSGEILSVLVDWGSSGLLACVTSMRLSQAKFISSSIRSNEIEKRRGAFFFLTGIRGFLLKKGLISASERAGL